MAQFAIGKTPYGQAWTLFTISNRKISITQNIKMSFRTQNLLQICKNPIKSS